jgi:hypothetical protein
MHAYAAVDPVFFAMNQRGQRETNGELGDFCVSCHAPMAVREGYTTDGLDLADVPEELTGVTCFFCHSIDAVEEPFNAGVHLADDLTIRGPFADPDPAPPHLSAYSPLHDRTRIESADLCGNCHDIVTPAGVHLERTFAEWHTTLFSRDIDGQRQTCGSCHMDGRDGLASVMSTTERRLHSHTFAGVDVALTDFPQMGLQREEVQKSLDTVLASQLRVAEYSGGTEARLTLENVAAGHGWPSGAAADRRAWVQLQAWDTADQLIYSSGVVPDGTPLTTVAATDPDLWRLGDEIFDENGDVAHMFWDARSYESEQLDGLTGYSEDDPDWTLTHVNRFYLMEGLYPARVSAQVFIRPIGLDILDDLIASGDLAPEHREAMPTFELRSAAITSE